MSAARLFDHLPRPRAALLAALVLLLWTIVGATWFLRHYLGLVTVDQVLFHLQNGGLSESDSRMHVRALRCLFFVVALTALSVFLLQRMRRWHRLPLLALLGTGAVVSVNATVSDPCQPEPDGGDYLARHYVDPRQVKLQMPAVKPDILVVFVESLDEDYTHPRATQAPLLPRLTALQEDFQTLGELHNLSGASWTVGGMFTSMCGVPLQPVGVMSHNAFEYSRHFFEGGRCLTDLLAAQGWDISFYGGASLKFAGKGRFLQDHGVTRRFGAEQWKQMGVPVPKQGWGLLDSVLAGQAWADMQRPRRDDEPRMSLVLTVDTHSPSGAHRPELGAAGAPPRAGRVAAGAGAAGHADRAGQHGTGQRPAVVPVVAVPAAVAERGLNRTSPGLAAVPLRRTGTAARADAGRSAVPQRWRVPAPAAAGRARPCPWAGPCSARC